MDFWLPNSCQKNSDNISGVRVTTILPIPDRDTSITMILDYDVYYWNSLRCYRVPVNFDSSVNGVSLLHEKRNTYFVFSKDSLYGINFDLVNREMGRQRIIRLKVDSFTSTYNRMFNESKNVTSSNPDSSYVTDDKEWVNMYQFKKTKQYPEDFTYLYYYSKKFIGIPERLSNKYDIVRGKKLFKVVADAHGAWYESEKFQMPPRQYIWKMDDIPPDEIAIAAKYFREYLKMQKK